VAKDPQFANDFFRRYVEGREVPDFAALFAPAGFRFSQDSVVKPFFGASMDSVARGVVINWASEVGSAYAAGLSDGDVVVAVDGEPATSPGVLNAIIGRHRVGDVVRLEVLQKGVAPSTVSIGLNGLPDYKLDTFESARLPISEAMRAFRTRWLSSQIVQ
jgi:predicted metalloprotease with PDZ domain